MDTNSALRDCYHNGWLQAELVPGTKTVYIFPTKIHQWYKFSIIHSHHYSKLILSLSYAERLLYTAATSFPKDQFRSIKDLCFAAVRAFSCVSLSSVERGIGPGAVTRPLEAQYQDAVRRQVANLQSAYVDALSARQAVRFARTSLEGLNVALKEDEFTLQALRREQ